MYVILSTCVHPGLKLQLTGILFSLWYLIQLISYCFLMNNKSVYIAMGKGDLWHIVLPVDLHCQEATVHSQELVFSSLILLIPPLCMGITGGALGKFHYT